MGILADMYNESFSVYRNVTTSITATDTATATYTGTCLVRPVTNTTQLLDVNNWGKEYKLWCDEDVPLRVGDLITIDSVKYGVIGIRGEEDLEDDTDSHLEVRVLKK